MHRSSSVNAGGVILIEGQGLQIAWDSIWRCENMSDVEKLADDATPPPLAEATRSDADNGNGEGCVSAHHPSAVTEAIIAVMRWHQRQALHSVAENLSNEASVPIESQQQEQPARPHRGRDRLRAFAQLLSRGH